MSIRINPLSVAKGHSHTCELCSQTATLLCSACRVTFYCSQSHLRVDAAGIHSKICSLLGALRSLRPTLGSEDERQRRQLTIAMSHHALIDLCKHEAQRWIIKGQHELAVPGALQALRFSIELYGNNRLELVPAYLLLAEGNIGLGRLKAAEEYLLYANWAVLQSAAACPSSTHSLLRRHFGNLYVKQGRLDAALSSYALDVYHASREFGPEHIETSNGIFHMGCTFMLSATAASAASSAPPQPPPPARAVESCLAFFDKYVDIWYKFLLHLRARQEESIADYLHDHQLATATASLLHIVKTRSSRLGRRHIATAEAVYVLGLLKLMGGADVDADWLLRRAEAVYSDTLGADNESTVGIRRAREEMGEVRMQRGERMPDWEEEQDTAERQNDAGDAAALTPLKAQQEEKQQMPVTDAVDAQRSRVSSAAAGQSEVKQQQQDDESEENKEEEQPRNAEEAEEADDGAVVVQSEPVDVKREAEESSSSAAAALESDAAADDDREPTPDAAAEAEDEQQQVDAGGVSHRSTNSESQSRSAVSLSAIQPAAED